MRQTQVNVDGQAQIQVRPPVEIAGEISLKVEEQPKAPFQSQVETTRETNLNVEASPPKVLVPPQVETTRDTGVKVEEQKKAQVHPQAAAGVAAGFRPGPGEKSHAVADVPKPGGRKDQTNPAGDTKTSRRP